MDSIASQENISDYLSSRIKCHLNLARFGIFFVASDSVTILNDSILQAVQVNFLEVWPVDHSSVRKVPLFRRSCQVEFCIPFSSNSILYPIFLIACCSKLVHDLVKDQWIHLFDDFQGVAGELYRTAESLKLGGLFNDCDVHVGMFRERIC